MFLTHPNRNFVHCQVPYSRTDSKSEQDSQLATAIENMKLSNNTWQTWSRDYSKKQLGI